MATKTKHTPGPWERAGRTVYALEEVRGPRGRMETRIRFMIGVQSGPSTPVEEVEAVAALVQVAPEMAEALVALLDFANSGGEHDFYDGAEGTDVRRLAEAALAKAGVTP